MTDPKKGAENAGRKNDDWGPGQMDDGAIDIMTEEAAQGKIIERDADESAFDDMLEGETDDTFEEDLDDVSDLEAGE